jgi:hypothetical protein
MQEYVATVDHEQGKDIKGGKDSRGIISNDGGIHFLILPMVSCFRTADQ